MKTILTLLSFSFLSQTAYGRAPTVLAACVGSSPCTYSSLTELTSYTMSCADGAMTAISSSYGLGTIKESCLPYVSSLCNGLASCTINLNNSSCNGNPVPGQNKFGTVQITCLAANAFSVSSPASDSSVSAHVTIAGTAGSEWVNIAAYSVLTGVKLGPDVKPINGQYHIVVDTSLLSNGLSQIAVVAFSVPSGQAGGQSAKIDLTLNVNNTSPLPRPIAGQNYVMTFDDEFTSLSTISNSNVFNGAKWYNGVEQCCMSDSTGLPGVMYPTVYNGVSVDPYSLISGGGLNITLSKHNNVWYSGVLTSVDKSKAGFKQQFGYFEMSAQMPSGVGTWPAFWMLSTDPALPGEIDIMESYGHDQGTTFGITLHDWRNGGNNTNISNSSFFPKVSGMMTGYHTYGLLWTSTIMTFYYDGVEVWSHPTPAVMQQPYYLLMDLGIGAGWPTVSTPLTNTMKIKYVRAYAPK